jgi:RND family efflux transporter MFP subunit
MFAMRPDARLRADASAVPHRSAPPAPACLLALVLLLALAGCTGDKTGDGADGADSTATAAAADTANAEADEPKREKAIKVDVGSVHRGALVIPVFADGVLRTTKTVEVRSQLGGELTEVLVRDGDRVRAGQVLARLDARPYRLALEESRLRHIRALGQIAAEDEEQVDDPAAMTTFLAQRDELQARRDRGEIDPAAHAAALLDLELAALKAGAFRRDAAAQRTGLAEARIAEERARLDLEHAEIRAPFGGVVSSLTAVKGANIPVGQTIGTVSDNTRLEAVVNVLEADLGELAAGSAALVAVPAAGDTIRGAVDVISPVLDQTSRTCQVLIRFANPDGRFRPGMVARAEVAARIHRDLLLVPRDAVLTRDDRPLVFKAADDRAQWLYVDTGRQNAAWIEILAVHSGGSLAHGDLVVVSDHLTLAHEAKLDVRRTVPTDDRWASAAGGEAP